MFTSRQLHLIKQATALGHGYRIFAYNVEKQGWCSAKQEAALDKMVAAGTYRKNNWTNKRYSARSGYHYTGRYGASFSDWDDYDGSEEGNWATDYVGPFG